MRLTHLPRQTRLQSRINKAKQEQIFYYVAFRVPANLVLCCETKCPSCVNESQQSHEEKERAMFFSFYFLCSTPEQKFCCVKKLITVAFNHIGNIFVCTSMFWPWHDLFGLSLEKIKTVISRNNEEISGGDIKPLAALRQLFFQHPWGGLTAYQT